MRASGLRTFLVLMHEKVVSDSRCKRLIAVGLTVVVPVRCVDNTPSRLFSLSSLSDSPRRHRWRAQCLDVVLNRRSVWNLRLVSMTKPKVPLSCLTKTSSDDAAVASTQLHSIVGCPHQFSSEATLPENARENRNADCLYRLWGRQRSANKASAIAPTDSAPPKPVPVRNGITVLPLVSVRPFEQLPTKQY